MTDFSDYRAHEKGSLRVYCDGGARGNPGQAAIAFIIKNQHNQTVHRHAETIGVTTNNVAEYKAVIAALEFLVKTTAAKHSQFITIFLDSQLVARQLAGKFRIKTPHLLTLVRRVRQIEESLAVGLQTQTNRGGLFFSPSIAYEHIPRELNSEADELVNQALDQSPSTRS